MRSPTILHSDLSKASEKLLESEQFTDMVFEIPVNNSHSGKSPISQMNEQLLENLSGNCNDLLNNIYIYSTFISNIL